MRRIYFCTFVLLLILPEAILGEKYNFKTYSVEDGLGQSQVLAICQDSRGYVWFGTNGGGVNKYDGVTFANFTTKEGLCDNTVSSILEDREGNLWFGTDGGVSKFDGKTFTNFTTKEGLCDNTVSSILEDREGNLWFGTDRGVSKFDGETFTSKEGLSDCTVWSILEAREGNLWFGTNSGVSRFDGKTFTNFTTKEGLSNNTVWCILEDREGNLWFGTDLGVSKYDGKTFTNFTTKEGLSNNTVWCILEDWEGNLWFGTDGGGVSKYAGKAFIYYTTKDGLNNDVVLAIFEDREGNLWFGTDGGGVSKYNGEAFTNYTTQAGLSNNVVLAIFEDWEGNIWFGTYGGTSKFDGKTFTNYTTKEGLIDNVVCSIFEDWEGNIWFGTAAGLSKFDQQTFTNFTTKEGLSDNSVLCILQDRGGNMWFGTDAGVSEFDGKTFTTKEDLSNYIVLSMLEDGEGNLWFGTYGGGVSKYNYPRKGEVESFETFTSRDGLCDDAVLSMVFDDAGNLWIGTNKGVDRFDTSGYKKTGKKIFKHYGREEGFIGIECNQNAVCKDSKGDIWFGTVKRVVKYVSKNDRPNMVEPVTHITNLRLFSGDVDWSIYTDSVSKKSGLPVGLELPYNQNHITFDFIGVSLTIPEKVRYRCKLEGFDKNWSHIMREAHVTYSNLPPGKYTFRVIACNGDDVWNKKPTNYSFAIIPPFWRTWWFYFFCMMAGTGIIYTLVKMRIRNLERKRRILEEKVDMRTIQLKEEKGKVEKINEALKKIKDELEMRVEERTSELRVANKQLKKEIAERKKAEEEKEKIQAQFYQAQKMESIGRLAGGIAHDFNNLLTAIQGYTYLSMKKIDRSEPLHKYLGHVRDATVRGTDLTNQLLLFSRRQQMEFTSLNVNETVDDLLKMLSYLIGDDITVDINLQPDPWMVWGDKGNIEQVIMNLALNARDAMPKGGKLTIETQNVTLKKKDCEVIPESRPGRFVCLLVADMGIGMDGETVQNIFEPFFSTKEVGKGTGLGLSTAYGIIKQHEGWINVYSECGKGSVFKVYLPAHSTN